MSVSIVAWNSLIIPTSAGAAGPKYYGYYASAPSIREVADHSNTVWIVNFQDPKDIKAAILEADCLNMRSIVDLGSILFYQKILQTNWRGNWENMANELRPLIDKIAAFYPIDEPDNNVNNESDLLIAIDAIKTSFPAIPVAVIYDGRGHLNNMKAFDKYDWIGADCYTNDVGTCSSDYYNYMLQTIRGRISQANPPKQRMFLVPQTYLPPGAPNDDTARLDAMEKQYQQSIHFIEEDKKAEHPVVVGVFPFLWQDFDSNRGLNSLPENLRNEYIALGKSIVANSELPLTGCSTAKVMSVVTGILDR